MAAAAAAAVGFGTGDPSASSQPLVSHPRLALSPKPLPSVAAFPLQFHLRHFVFAQFHSRRPARPTARSPRPLAGPFAVSHSHHLSLSLGPNGAALKPDRGRSDPSGEGKNRGLSDAADKPEMDGGQLGSSVEAPLK